MRAQLFTRYKEIATKLTLAYALMFCTPSLHGFDISSPFYARFMPKEPRLMRQEFLTLGAVCAETTGERLLRPHVNKSRELRSNYDQLSIQYLGIEADFNVTKNIFTSITVPFYFVRGRHTHTTKINDQRSEKHFHSFYKKTIGNAPLLVGLTTSYTNHPAFDYIDATMAIGVTLPISSSTEQQVGMPLMLSCAAGIFDWLSCGLSADAIFFTGDHGHTQRNVHWFLKADHIIKGFSITGGYSYSADGYGGQSPWKTKPLHKWSMHTMHWMLSYDLAQECEPWLPSVDFFYNHPLSGKHILENGMMGVRVSGSF